MTFYAVLTIYLHRMVLKITPGQKDQPGQVLNFAFSEDFLAAICPQIIVKKSYNIFPPPTPTRDIEIDFRNFPPPPLCSYYNNAH